MARGYPDFFGTSVFPSPGSASRSVSGGTNCPAGAVTSILTLTGKGTVFAGWISFINSPGLLDLFVQLTVDGLVLAKEDIYQLYKYNNSKPLGNLLYIELLSPDYNECQIGLGENVSYGQSYDISVDNQLGVLTTAYYNVNYYDVQ